MRMLRALPPVFLIPFLAACPAPQEEIAPPAQEPAPAEVAPPDAQALAGRWVEAFHAGDYQAVAALYSTDGRYVLPSGEAFEGRAAIRDALAEVPPSRLDVDVIRSDAGDQFGYAAGRYIQQVEGLEEPLEGRFLLALEHDGQEWRIVEQVSILSPESQERAAALMAADEAGQ